MMDGRGKPVEAGVLDRLAGPATFLAQDGDKDGRTTPVRDPLEILKFLVPLGVWFVNSTYCTG